MDRQKAIVLYAIIEAIILVMIVALYVMRKISDGTFMTLMFVVAALSGAILLIIIKQTE